MTEDDRWPRHKDGRRMKVGEMSKEQRRKVFADACTQLKGEFADPRFQAGLAKVLEDAE